MRLHLSTRIPLACVLIALESLGMNKGNGYGLANEHTVSERLQAK